MDVAAPAAEDLHALRQLGGQQVAGAVVRVLDQDVVAAAGKGALARRADLGGHLAAEGLVVRLAQLGFVPVADAAGAFDVRGNENSIQHVVLLDVGYFVTSTQPSASLARSSSDSVSMTALAAVPAAG